MDSILNSIKKLLGLIPEDDSFDIDVITHINTAMAVLTQIGVGPATGFSIADDTATWDDYLNCDLRLSMVKTYVYLKVRSLFDPPTSGSATEALKRQLDEYESRINILVDTGNTEENQNV